MILVTLVFYEREGQKRTTLFKNAKEACLRNLDHILKLTIFLTDLSKFDQVNAIMMKRFSEPFPARATLEISKLPKGVDIEMDAILSIQV